MRNFYPIMLRLEGKRVVVVGGGKAAERKVSSLLDSGAEILVIAPEATAEIERLASEGELVWQQRPFLKTDLKGAFLVFAATNDRQLNQFVKDSAAADQLVMLADAPDSSDFHLPSTLKRGRLNIAVSTGGASPLLAKEIRRQLEGQFADTYEEYLEFLYEKRQWILNEVADPVLKRKLLTAIVSPEFLTSSHREADFQRLYKELEQR